MWGIARAVAGAIFGDDIVKYVLYVVAGVFAFIIIQGGSFLVVLSGQPWGAWSLGGPAAAPFPPASQGAQVAVPVPTLAPLQIAPVQSASRVGQVLAAAMSWLGTPYRWAGCDHRGIDCSCMVMLALRAAGIDAPRTTVTQVRWARPVLLIELQPGDLLFFDNTCTGCGPNPTHVGFYLGDGRQFDCGDPCGIHPLDRGHLASAGRIP